MPLSFSQSDVSLNLCPPTELQNNVAAHANRTGTYALRVGRPAAAHQLRAYTHWAHRTPTAPRPSTHLLHHATAPSPDSGLGHSRRLHSGEARG